MSAATILEMTMLICFGCAWPLASLRILRTRRVDGRGLLPTALIFCGYVAGMGAKLCACSIDGCLASVFWLYLLNAVSVGVNLGLQWYFSRPRQLSFAAA